MTYIRIETATGPVCLLVRATCDLPDRHDPQLNEAYRMGIGVDDMQRGRGIDEVRESE